MTLNQTSALPLAGEPEPEPPALPAGPPARRAATLGQVRVPYAHQIVIGICGLAFLWLLYSVRHLDFFGDEWDFLGNSPRWTLRDYFVPHNEHWSTVPMIVYEVLLHFFGAASYLPYSAALLVVHVAAAYLLYRIVAPRSGDALGIAAAATLLVLAGGTENIFWAFQIGFVGSVTFGLLAIYLLQGEHIGRARGAIASAALVTSLACSGMGLFLVAAAAVDLLLDRRRRLLWVLAAPVALYGLWYLTYGMAATSVHRSPFSIEAWAELAGYVPTGIGAGLAGMISLSPTYGQLALIAGTATITATVIRNRNTSTLAIGAGVAVIVQFVLTGLVRAQFGDGQATSSRYIYVVAVFGLLIFTEAARGLPWRGTWRPVLIAIFAAITIHDIAAVSAIAKARSDDFALQRAELQTTWLFRNAPGFDPTAVIDTNRAPTLTAGRYVQIRTQRGSQHGEITLADLTSLPGPMVNHTIRQVLPLRFDVAPTTPGVPAKPGDSVSCQQVQGGGSNLEFAATDGSKVWISSESAAADGVAVGQWFAGTAMDDALTKARLAVSQTLTVTAADTGLGLPRRLVVAIPAGTRAMVCGSVAA